MSDAKRAKHITIKRSSESPQVFQYLRIFQFFKNLSKSKMVKKWLARTFTYKKREENNVSIKI